MGHRHLRKADLARNACQDLLMLRIPIGMHQHDGDAAKPAIEGRLHLLASRLFLQRMHHLAIAREPLIDLDHLTMQQLGQDDLPIEQTGSILVSNAGRIGKTAREHQEHRLARALEQGIGRHGRSHLDRCDGLGRHWLIALHAQQPANPFDGRVGILLGVVGQQLGRQQCAVRASTHHVSEGASAVDPEFPARAGCSRGVVHGQPVSDAASRSGRQYRPSGTGSRCYSRMLRGVGHAHPA